MTRNSGRFGFSRVVWDHELLGSDDEDDSTTRETSSASEDAAMDVDSSCTPPQKIDSRPPPHSSPMPPSFEIQSETEKAREIIGGIKLCRIWVEPLDKGQVCYQGDSRFRILKMNWRREAELRRMAATISDQGVTQSGSDTTQPPQLAGHSPVVSSSHTSHFSKKPASTKKNTDSSSTLRNATRKGTHTTSTDVFQQWKLTGTLRMKKKREKAQSQTDNGEFPAAIPTIWNCQEALACPMEGCGTHFTRQTDYIRHMRTVHRRRDFVCRECGRSVSRLDSLKRHATKVHKGTSSMLGGNSRSLHECA